MLSIILNRVLYKVSNNAKRQAVDLTQAKAFNQIVIQVWDLVWDQAGNRVMGQVRDQVLEQLREKP